MFGILSPPPLPALFGASGAIVLVVSVRQTHLADTIADRAGLGQALVAAFSSAA